MTLAIRLADRTAPAAPANGRKPRRVPAGPPCGVPGCGEATTGRKPYCIDHIDRLPYPRALAVGVAALAGEARHLAASPARAPRAGPRLVALARDELVARGGVSRLAGLACAVAREVGEPARTLPRGVLARALRAALERCGAAVCVLAGDPQGRVRPVLVAAERTRARPRG